MTFPFCSGNVILNSTTSLTSVFILARSWEKLRIGINCE